MPINRSNPNRKFRCNLLRFQTFLQQSLNVSRFFLCVSARCLPPNGAVSGSLVSAIDSGHLEALYGCEAEETALAR